MDGISRWWRARAPRSQFMIAVPVAGILALSGGVFAASVSRDDAGTSSSPSGATKTAKSAGPTTTLDVGPISPLTGLHDPTGLVTTRGVIAVKIDNAPPARPQAGLDIADVVYEEVVEGGITRFIALFHSRVPDRVGPIRSVRFMDPDVVSPLGGIFAFSGGTAPNVSRIREAPVQSINETQARDAFVRDHDRNAPHNLFGLPEKIWAMAENKTPPPALFSYLGDGTAFHGEPALGVEIEFSGGWSAAYAYDARHHNWGRSMRGEQFRAESGDQVTPENLVVQFVGYSGSGGKGETIGSGEAWIFVDGQVIRGTWEHPGRTSVTKFFAPDGSEIQLRPGRTWVHLAPIGADVTIDTGSPVTTIAQS